MLDWLLTVNSSPPPLEQIFSSDWRQRSVLERFAGILIAFPCVMESRSGVLISALIESGMFRDSGSYRRDLMSSWASDKKSESGLSLACGLKWCV